MLNPVKKSVTVLEPEEKSETVWKSVTVPEAFLLSEQVLLYPVPYVVLALPLAPVQAVPAVLD